MDLLFFFCQEFSYSYLYYYKTIRYFYQPWSCVRSCQSVCLSDGRWWVILSNHLSCRCGVCRSSNNSAINYTRRCMLYRRWHAVYMCGSLAEHRTRLRVLWPLYKLMWENRSSVAIAAAALVYIWTPPPNISPDIIIEMHNKIAFAGGRPPANAWIYLRVVTSGHVTKMAATPFDPP